MYAHGLYVAVRCLQEHGVDCTFAVLPGAGHHLYLDNTPEFHRVVDAWLRDSVSVTGRA